MDQMRGKLGLLRDTGFLHLAGRVLRCTCGLEIPPAFMSRQTPEWWECFDHAVSEISQQTVQNDDLSFFIGRMSHCGLICPISTCKLARTPVSLGCTVSSGGDNSAKFSGPSLRREFTRRLVLISVDAKDRPKPDLSCPTKVAGTLCVPSARP